MGQFQLSEIGLAPIPQSKGMSPALRHSEIILIFVSKMQKPIYFLNTDYRQQTYCGQSRTSYSDSNCGQNPDDPVL